MNRDNTARCPFEQLSLLYSNPRDLLPAIRAKLVELRTRR
jgi:hypothetical protein